MPVSANVESSEDVVKIVSDVSKQIGVAFNRSDVFRAHRVGKKKSVNGKEVQQVIVKWRSWDARNAFYRARPTFKKPIKLPTGQEKMFSSIGLDLTKTRLTILQEARAFIEAKGDKSIYAFCDMNCAPCVCLERISSNISTL